MKDRCPKVEKLQLSDVLLYPTDRLKRPFTLWIPPVNLSYLEDMSCTTTISKLLNDKVELIQEVEPEIAWGSLKT